VIASEWAGSVWIKVPDEGSHTRRVESAAAETRVVGESERRPTRNVWPVKLCRSWPVARDHIRTVPSIDPEHA
jgi:hypothetical protein